MDGSFVQMKFGTNLLHNGHFLQIGYGVFNHDDNLGVFLLDKIQHIAELDEKLIVFSCFFGQCVFSMTREAMFPPWRENAPTHTHTQDNNGERSAMPLVLFTISLRKNLTGTYRPNENT
jgi:hypothetical protein